MKAQTSIELLLLLGGAILVAVIIGMALKNMGGIVGNQATNQINCTALDCSTCKKTVGCMVYWNDGTAPLAGSGTADCTATELPKFDSCKGA